MQSFVGPGRKLRLRVVLILCLAALAVSPALARRVRHPRRVVRVRHVIVVGRPVVLVAPIVIKGRPHGAIDVDVEPETTQVFVDGTLRGQADDFDGIPQKLYLLPGTHRIMLKTPDGEEVSQKVRVVAGEEINLKMDLEKD